MDAREFVTPEQYVANLNTIYNEAREHLTPTGVFIWASSTPVPFPSEYKLRNNSAVQHYNSLASQLFASKSGVVINDLVTFKHQNTHLANLYT